MIEARCIRDCTWNGLYWKIGETYRGGAKPPLHFAIVREDEPVVPEAEKPDDAGAAKGRKKTKEE